ncbi:hypothetical protein N8T08_006692 [Aspergillus melleus]|uniref:Uncharacterized protein n=1 Tax=Aspergillus melleus TaxID=138277 RepID=A0ACC3AZD0_9EURO|nr:hypothetical protein N8T08_006692 [Aspergillus melleus]
MTPTPTLTPLQDQNVALALPCLLCTWSSPAKQSKRPKAEHDRSRNSRRHRDAQFCTQKCLLDLRRRGKLDENCPNVKLHRENGSNHHRTTTRGLVSFVKHAVDECLENAEPMGTCGLSGASFKVICVRYGYTVVGKGTTCFLWPQLEREAGVYQMLSPAQGRALIIDFHLCEFDLHRVKKKPKWLVEKDSGLSLAEDNDEALRHCPYHGACIHRLVESCPNEKHSIY